MINLDFFTLQIQLPKFSFVVFIFNCSFILFCYEVFDSPLTKPMMRRDWPRFRVHAAVEHFECPPLHDDDDNDDVGFDLSKICMNEKLNFI